MEYWGLISAHDPLVSVEGEVETSRRHRQDFPLVLLHFQLTFIEADRILHMKGVEAGSLLTAQSNPAW